jgi:hypothetical protein
LVTYCIDKRRYAVGSLVRGSPVNQDDAKVLGLVNVLQQLAAKSPDFKVRAKAFSLLGDLTLERHCPNAAIDHQRLLLSEMLSDAKDQDTDGSDSPTESIEVASESLTTCEVSPLVTVLADREHGQWFADQVRALAGLEAFPKPRLLAQVAKAAAHACLAYTQHNCDLKQHAGVAVGEANSLLHTLQEAVAGLDSTARSIDVTTSQLREALEILAIAFEQVVDAEVWNGASEC